MSKKNKFRIGLIIVGLIIVYLFNRCTVIKPVPDTRPSYYKLAKQAEQITNLKP